MYRTSNPPGSASEKETGRDLAVINEERLNEDRPRERSCAVKRYSIEVVPRVTSKLVLFEGRVFLCCFLILCIM